MKPPKNTASAITAMVKALTDPPSPDPVIDKRPAAREPIAWFHPASKRVRWENKGLPPSWKPLYKD